jgi:hypothetical protein
MIVPILRELRGIGTLVGGGADEEGEDNDDVDSELFVNGLTNRTDDRWTGPTGSCLRRFGMGMIGRPFERTLVRL